MNLFKYNFITYQVFKYFVEILTPSFIYCSDKLSYIENTHKTSDN